MSKEVKGLGTFGDLLGDHGILLVRIFLWTFLELAHVFAIYWGHHYLEFYLTPMRWCGLKVVMMLIIVVLLVGSLVTATATTVALTRDVLITTKLIEPIRNLISWTWSSLRKLVSAVQQKRTHHTYPHFHTIQIVYLHRMNIESSTASAAKIISNQR